MIATETHPEAVLVAAMELYVTVVEHTLAKKELITVKILNNEKRDHMMPFFINTRCFYSSVVYPKKLVISSYQTT